jgi:hypothetical protein
VLGRGAVPVLLVAGDAYDVAGADGDDRSAAGLHSALALGDVEGLADRVVVPGGVGAGREMHRADRERRTLGLGDGVDVDVAGELLGRTFGGRVLRLDFHVVSFGLRR